MTYPKAGDLQAKMASHLTANPSKSEARAAYAQAKQNPIERPGKPLNRNHIGFYREGDLVEMAHPWPGTMKTELDRYAHAKMLIIRNGAGVGHTVGVVVLGTGERREFDARTNVEKITRDYLSDGEKRRLDEATGRHNPSESTFDSDILEGMTRAIWVTSYADWVDEQGETAQRKLGARGGQDWNDVAPDSPPSALLAAEDLYAAIERANGKTPGQLLELAAKADGKRATERYADSFGHYLAMQAMGHGVSWFDDHAEFPLKLPHFEFHSPDGMTVEWSPQRRFASNPRGKR